MPEPTRYQDLVVHNDGRSRQIAALAAACIKAHGRPGIVFVIEKEHARRLAELVSKELKTEIPCVTGDTRRGLRQDLAEDMRQGLGPPVAVATMVWSTGLNIPGLRWVIWAGEGRAPVRLKQGGARGSRRRADLGKTSYEIYDVRTVGPGTESFQAQAEERAEHYKAMGLDVAPLGPPEDDQALLEELRELPRGERPLWGELEELAGAAREAARLVQQSQRPVGYWRQGWRDAGLAGQTILVALILFIVYTVLFFTLRSR